MTQNPYSPQDGQPAQQTPTPAQQSPTPAPAAGEPMNVYPAPGVSGAGAKPVWPTVVGIISLCLAGLGSLMTIVGQIFQAFAADFQPPQQRDMLANMPDWHQAYQWSIALIGIAIYVMLAIGGVMLLKRRRVGRTLHVAYALVGIVLAIVGTVVGLILVDYMQFDGPEEMQTITKVTSMGGIIIGLFISLAYPVFLLIWFARPKVKAETRLWR